MGGSCFIYISLKYIYLFAIKLSLLFTLLLVSCNDKELNSNFDFNNDLYNYNYDQLYEIDAYEFLKSIEGEGLEYEFFAPHFKVIGLSISSSNKKNITLYFEIDKDNMDTIDINYYKNKDINRISVYENYKSSSLIVDYIYYL